jgi:hypothetical protein
MKLSFHQHIALFWMIGAPGVFAPVIENAKRPDAGAVMAWGVAIVAVMILFTPLLLRCPPFRRWYGRTDALSERQRQALAERGLRRYYQTAFDDGYVPRDALRVAHHLDGRRVDGCDRRTAYQHRTASLRCLGGLLDLVSDRRDAAGFRVEAPWPVDSPKSTGAAEMSTSTIEALASAWARIAEEAEFPADYEGTATPQAHRASEAIQEQIRERIVATNDMRLFSLLHLLGQASLRMEQALWPEDYERMTREVEEALRQATDANARSYTHEEVMQAMQERIDRARDKPC